MYCLFLTAIIIYSNKSNMDATIDLNIKEVVEK